LEPVQVFFGRIAEIMPTKLGPRRVGFIRQDFPAKKIGFARLLLEFSVYAAERTLKRELQQSLDLRQSRQASTR
jgi:hypothetical protein